MIKKDVELQPFRVPNYVLQKAAPRTRQEGIQETPKFRLSELDTETLEALCDRFRADVLAKARAGEDS